MAATKRMAEQAASRPAKKSRNAMVSGVIDAINCSASLPESSKELLIVMAESSLQAPCNTRHQIDDLAVELIEKEILQVKSDYHVQVAEMTRLKDASAESLSTLLAARSELEAALDKAKAEVRESKYDLAAVMEDFIAKRDAVKSAARDKQEKNELAATLTQQLADFKAALEGLKALTKEDAESLESEEVTKNRQAVEAVLGELAMEDSLRVSVPSTLNKTVAERGMFDAKVFEKLELTLVAKVEEVAKELESVQQSASEMETTEETRREEHTAVTDALKSKASVFKTCEDSMTKEQSQLDESLTKEVLAKEEVSASDVRMTEAAETLKSFEEFNIWCFETLKTRESKPEPVPEATPSEEAPEADAPAASEESAAAAVPSEEVEEAPAASEEAAAASEEAPAASEDAPAAVEAEEAQEAADMEITETVEASS